MKNKPIIGISMGDASGISPEIIIKYFLYGKKGNFNIVVFGASNVFEFYKRLFKLDFKINAIDRLDNIKEEALNVFNCTSSNPKEVAIGQIDKQSGKLAFESINYAIDMAISQKIDAYVSAPINKKAMNLAGFNYPGHTEILAQKTNTKKYVMMLGYRNFRVSLVTTHVSLRQVSDLVTKERVFDTILISHKDLIEKFGVKKPKILVCSLNPHNSENGMFGSQEELEIIPAVQQAKESGIDVVGSVAADTAFIPQNRKIYDLFVSMYHDQGLSVLKALYFDKSVNITLGLPIIRTSPDHGSAFDIAGKFIASFQSMQEAILQAYSMIKCTLKNR
ncbi:4-hydroxythreonine-4-phosphate dehydrogenase PdxA [Desulfurella multipotens]|uniref:4-hydroxythreonine-4-phosphate dehydrogenase n=2 Tax=Desulfurella TaxID=33001 RepID=A0A1G6JMF6_9BACT|nr:4-hydroxythreonine-4-phosphate dehydrogenase PdxA [Desulfurella multipotens]PMP62791.1 MAG: 4-hydroxythreonine-4-phosphate dehydrogenase PdxA [Desulfurella multipotens]SDC19893.1 4-hydroxythreonine-4-phosphate dehydrogenase [Desulfurella multipotens]HEX14159.1 4-hydroxythreonine-4-phosphate dehydrogenase PdxA [Desulfurella acetivorans]